MKQRHIIQPLLDADFFQTCQKVAKRNADRRLSVKELTRLAAASPAPSYYLTLDYAINQLRRIRLSGVYPFPDSARGQKWIELDERVRRIERRRNIPFTKAVEKVLTDGKASSFFLSPTSAMRIYYRHLAKLADEQCQNDQSLTNNSELT